MRIQLFPRGSPQITSINIFDYYSLSSEHGVEHKSTLLCFTSSRLNYQLCETKGSGSVSSKLALSQLSIWWLKEPNDFDVETKLAHTIIEKSVRRHPTQSFSLLLIETGQTTFFAD